MNAKASGKVLSDVWGANNQATKCSANHSLSLMPPYFVTDGRLFACGGILGFPNL
ncbi:hypothetical protein ACFL53_05060 [Pseudomonadota bacterium]